MVADGEVLLRVDGDERRLVAGEAREFRGESEASAVAVGHPAQVVNLMVVRGSAEFHASGPHLFVRSRLREERTRSSSCCGAASRWTGSP